jgi:hypothetical protein
MWCVARGGQPEHVKHATLTRQGIASKALRAAELGKRELEPLVRCQRCCYHAEVIIGEVVPPDDRQRDHVMQLLRQAAVSGVPA